MASKKQQSQANKGVRLENGKMFYKSTTIPEAKSGTKQGYEQRIHPMKKPEQSHLNE
jgi:hypothetical protein